MLAVTLGSTDQESAKIWFLLQLEKEALRFTDWVTGSARGLISWPGGRRHGHTEPGRAVWLLLWGWLKKAWDCCLLTGDSDFSLVLQRRFSKQMTSSPREFCCTNRWWRAVSPSGTQWPALWETCLCPEVCAESLFRPLQWGGLQIPGTFWVMV